MSKSLVQELTEALQAASDQLDYCGYGDSWERGCAFESKLPEKIEAALKRAAEEVLKRHSPEKEHAIQRAHAERIMGR